MGKVATRCLFGARVQQMSSIRGQITVDSCEHPRPYPFEYMHTFPDNGEQEQTREELFHGGESGSIPLGSAINFNGLARLIRQRAPERLASVV